MGYNEDKKNMSLLSIEAYSMPSSTYVQNDSHCFVITQDKKEEWKNCGSGWSDSRPKTKVAENQAYKEWIKEFVPTNNVNKCGITFGVNGVCHTYANRELLIGEQNVNASSAPKDYVCVFFFGKYGIGLQQLKKLLTDSYNNVMKNYKDPYNALNKVLQRVDNYLEEELKAWRLVGMEYAEIPIDKILAKNPSDGISVARKRLQKYIDERETMYQQYIESGRVGNFKSKVKELIRIHSDDYLNMLCNNKYITSSERDTYSSNINKFLNKFASAVEAQENAL